MRKPFKLKSGNKPSIAQLSGVSPAKTTVREGGKYVDHEHEDGSKHTYAPDKTRPDGTTAPGGVDTKGTITPPENKKEMAEAGTKQAPTRHKSLTDWKHNKAHKEGKDPHNQEKSLEMAPDSAASEKSKEKKMTRKVETITRMKKAPTRKKGEKGGGRAGGIAGGVAGKKGLKKPPTRMKPEPTKSDVANMSPKDQQKYGRKIFRGPGTTEEKYDKLSKLGIELKGHEGAYSI